VTRTAPSAPAYRSSVGTARDGFVQILRSEWTKVRSVRSTVWCALAAIGLTVLVSLLTSASSTTDANSGPAFVDQFTFVHQRMDGDGTFVVHVASQRDSQEWAKAGIMIKENLTGGSPYAAVMVTPRHGVRMQAGFTTDVAGSGAGAPRWLMLTRSGATIAGYESADGTTWHHAGTVQLPGLPRTAELGMFVTSPNGLRVTKTSGGVSTSGYATVGTAAFDHVSVQPAVPQQLRGWTGQTVTDDGAPPTGGPATGTFTEADGAFTVTGTGDIAGYGIPSFQAGDDDIVANSLSGVQLGLLAVVALGVLAATAEYRTGMVRTTFAASPRRRRVLVAKGVVVGGVVFLAGLVASLVALFAAQPELRHNGFRPPAYPSPSLADPTVLRAVVGTALVLAVLAVFSLGVGLVLRRSARAIVLVIALVLVPQIVAAFVPSLSVQMWIDRLTPVAGLAIQHTRPRFDYAIGPWAGFAVLCAYAAAAMAAAMWLVRRRDA